MTDEARDGLEIDALMGDVPEDSYAHLSREELIAEIERKNRDLREKGRYGLKWEMKDEDIEDRLLEAFPRLVHVPELDVDAGVADGQPTHLLIEGDNLAALNALQATHAGRVDVAVLDVPYFTGSTDFRYNDSFVAKEDAYAHSKWLSFIHRRMVLVKKLLAPTGVLFVHIDDNEFAQLKLLLDGVMGPERFVSAFVWEKTRTPSNLSRTVRRASEYVLCYSMEPNPAMYGTAGKSGSNGLMNQSNRERELVFPAGRIDTGLPDGTLHAGVYGTDSYRIELLEDTEVREGIFILPVRLEGRFAWSQEYLDAEMAKGTSVSIRGRALSPSYVKAENKPPAPLSIIDQRCGAGTNEDGSQEIMDIFGLKVFDYPKPVSLIRYLIEAANIPNNGCCLDVFAGTGTTGQAVLELNAADGGTRTAILATNNENGICREVTRERLRKVMEGYVTPKGRAVEGTGGKLRYLTAWPLPSFEASPDDPPCIPREEALAEVSRMGLGVLAELVAIRHGAYAASEAGGVPLLMGPGVRVAVAATGRMAGIVAGLDALGGHERGTARHLYIPCRGEELPEAVVELCGRDGVTAHAIPADVLAKMRYEKAVD